MTKTISNKFPIDGSNFCLVGHGYVWKLPVLSFNQSLCTFYEREPDQERCDDNETEIHPQGFTSSSLEREEVVRGNNEIELTSDTEVDNEETDHAAAVPVPPIVIHDLEGQTDPDINTNTKNISSSIYFYLFFSLVYQRR